MRKTETLTARGSTRPARSAAWILALIGALRLPLTAAADAPSYAASVGYNTNTFSSRFDSSTVDLQRSGKPTFLWYPWQLFGRQTNTGAIKLNADGSVTLQGDITGPNGELTTATPAANAAGFVGTAFGGGAYIEAVFRFDPADVARQNSKGWPSFWSLTAEGSVLQGANQWPGQPAGFQHQVEADFFEYLLLPYHAPPNAYGASLHDWYGIRNVTCRGLCQQGMPPSVGKRLAPTNIDFTQYHRYGFLWVPATVAQKGYARFYLDGQPVGPDQQWTLFTGQPPPPTGQPWAFGVLDQQHLLLILGTGVGEPMTIQSVNVWQQSTTQNLHYP